MLIGKVHSIESFGTLDGPGVRTVVFLQGCPNRCKFCHNIDCAIKQGGKEYTPEQLVEEVMRNKEYWDDYSENKKGVRGGVTFSGGEPTFQTEFLIECVKLLKKEGVHVVVDSCVTTDFSNIEEVSKYIDLWMVSIKHMDDKQHLDLVGTGNTEILENIKMLDRLLTKNNKGQEIRIRFVVIPSLTDSKEHIMELGKYIKELTNIEHIELLPYSTIGKHKWIELFGKYDLEGIAEATGEDVQRVKGYLSEFTDKLI